VPVTRQLQPILLLVLFSALAVAVAIGGVVVFNRSDDAGVGETFAEAQLVFAEFGPKEDRVYLAPANDLEEHVLVARVPHASGWALTPAIEMVGSLVAFVALPPDTEPRRDAAAGLWLLNVVSGELNRFARDADLLVAPLLDREGRYLVYRSSNLDGTQSLVRVDLATRARRILIEIETNFGAFPVAFDLDGEVLFSELSTGGTDLYRVIDGDGTELLAHVSNHIARDWRLSPDGFTLSYLAPEIQSERVVHRLHLFSLKGEQAPAALEMGTLFVGDQFSPVWTPDGNGITFGLEPEFHTGVQPLTLVLDGADSFPPLAAPEKGFDVPLGWSADGRYLAARSFDGRDTHAPGRESLVVIDIDGGREFVHADRELVFIGWLLND
jgi:Tol biopolymer transport system component